MPALETILAGAMAVSLILYAVTGGADYGGGVWDLLAGGPTRDRQRALIERAISPVWEANHVWLILVVVVLFTAFPPAFAIMSIALHVPISLLLLGIVLRGAAFTFRAYDSRKDLAQRRWGAVFSGASIAAPILLGVIAGALVSGRVSVSGGEPSGGWIEPWAAPWPFLVGLFTLALFSYIAAVYLCVEAHDENVPQKLTLPFRTRALASWLTVAVLAIVLRVDAQSHAPLVASRLPIWIVGLTTIASLVALHSLVTHRYRTARIAAAAQVSGIVAGWAFSQYPFVIVPDLTITGAAAPERTLQLLLGALVLGSLLLFPSLALLFRTFKRR